MKRIVKLAPTRNGGALLALLLTTTSSSHAADVKLNINAAKPGVAVSPHLYGVFFEDINRAGDGGLYAEMVQNRSFEDSHLLLGWTPLANENAGIELTLDRQSPINPYNPVSLCLRVKNVDGRAGIYNQGFKGTPQYPREKTEEWLPRFEAAQREYKNGLAVETGHVYDFSLFARAVDFRDGTLTVSLESQEGEVLASQRFNKLSGGWGKFTGALKPNVSDADARLVLSVDKPGTLWLDMVSLFPRATYKNRPQGLRADMVAKMAAMNPKLLRFPGGSYSEGRILADAWKWKETLGPIESRPGTWNIWGYRSTSGLGFHEYLQLAEDLGAEPLYVAHVGMAEQGFVPPHELGPWLQDVLDAIEYANGDAKSTKWGKLRAQNGHPAPFKLKYVEIGNENGMGYSWGGGNREEYLARYKPFFERIKAKYPGIITIANIPTQPDATAEMIDEHYYETSEWFRRNATLYDNYDRKSPKIYVGEYAAKNDGGQGNLRAALGEAAFLTGVERNSDVVKLTSYAPLWTNPMWQRWSPNAIVFDNTRIYGTPSYEVQRIFATNRPDVILPITWNGTMPQDGKGIPDLFAVAGLKKETKEIIIKLVNTSGRERVAALDLGGAKLRKNGKITVLAGSDGGAENSFDNPTGIVAQQSPLNLTASAFEQRLPPYSLTVLSVPLV